MKHRFGLVIFMVFAVMFLLAGLASAQISITQGDALALIGKSQEVEIDTTGNVTVNVGSPGANQSWNLTPVNIQSFKASVDYLTPQGTPLQMYFPNANFVYSFTDTSGLEGYDEIIYYDYVEVTSTHYSSLGGGIRIPSLDTAFVLFMGNDAAPLPLTYNSTWTSTESDTVGNPAVFAIISLDTTFNTVDGWGTMQLPIGTFDCLRIRADNKYTEITVIGGQVQSVDVSNNITYSWISKSNFIVAEAESQDDDINPNFTTAAEFQRLASPVTGIKNQSGPGQKPASFELLQNYPNPFNPVTTISYRLPQSSDVVLSIYSVDGRLIKTLVNDFQTAGDYSIDWNASDISSGIYFVRINAGEFSGIRKAILMK